MTKRNITLAGIALILLIAIAITIVLGGKASPVSVGSLDSHSLNLEQLDLQQASFDLRLLDEAPAHLTAARNNKLNNKLNLNLDKKLNNKLYDNLKAKLNLKLDNNKLNKLNLKLNNKLNDRLDSLTLDSATSDAEVLALQLDLADNLKDGATLAVLGDGLAATLLNV